MKLQTTIFRWLLTLVAMLFLVFQTTVQAEDLGKIDFPNSGAPEAQENFIKGVLLLHSFEYWDARDEFKKAQEIDPGFAMAYWGEAMTYNHPIWNGQNKDAGKSALERLGATQKDRLAKAPTEREKDLLKALDIIFLEEGDKLTRDLKYSQAMKTLYEKYPDDLEIASFYALSILGTAQGKRDFRIYMRAGAIASDVFEKNPLHPGAAHYTIHSFDDPIHAPLGLKAAHVYADIAPDAPHALHMPSHIFMALGMWDESSSTNERSMAAAHKKGQHGLHATWWLTYSYLQQGRYKKAQELIDTVEKKLAASPTRSLRHHLAYMKSAYLVETRDWEAEFYPETLDHSIFRMQAIASILLAKGLQAVQLEELDNVRTIISDLKSLPAANARYSDEEALPIMIKELEASLQLATGLADEAITSLKEAAVLQEAMSYEFGPAIPVKPVYELYGDVLMELNRPQEAIEAYQKALNRDPLRALSLLGLARATAAAGDKEASAKAYAELKTIWHLADDGLAEMEEVNNNMSYLDR